MKSTNLMRGRTLFLAAAMLTALVAMAPIAVASTTTTTMHSVNSKGVPASINCDVAASDQVRVISSGANCTVATHVGGSFEIVLVSGWRWSTPVSSSKSVIVSNTKKSKMGVASAVLTATTVGVAVVKVTGTIYCAKGKVCPDLAVLMTWNVIVTKSASAALTIRLTSSDAGATYNVRRGDRFIVTLDATPKYKWSEPTVTSATVANRVAGRAGASASGRFVARTSGRTKLVATQTPNCGVHCSLKKQRFSVTVVVTSKS